MKQYVDLYHSACGFQDLKEYRALAALPRFLSNLRKLSINACRFTSTYMAMNMIPSLQIC